MFRGGKGGKNAVNSDLIRALHKCGASQKQIMNFFNIAQSTTSYHVNKSSKRKALDFPKRRGNKSLTYILGKKMHSFKRKKRRGGTIGNFKKDYRVEDVIKKFNININKPYFKCCLTGRTINLMKPSSYHFDHILPKSRGGTNDLYNLQIVTKEANLCKDRLDQASFLLLCNDVIENCKEQLELLKNDPFIF